MCVLVSCHFIKFQLQNVKKKLSGLVFVGRTSEYHLGFGQEFLFCGVS